MPAQSISGCLETKRQNRLIHYWFFSPLLVLVSCCAAHNVKFHVGCDDGNQGISERNGTGCCRTAPCGEGRHRRFRSPEERRFSAADPYDAPPSIVSISARRVASLRQRAATTTSDQAVAVKRSSKGSAASGPEEMQVLQQPQVPGCL